jgi:osmotically-inducible protein OsmY
MRFARTAILFLAASLFTAANSTSAAAQNGPSNPVPDEALKQSVIGRMLDARAAFFAEIQLDVVGGDALLTGHVRNLQDKARASALVRSVPGIQTVVNEIQVGGADDAKRITADLLIERQIRGAMREAFGARLPSLTWRVTNGVVYVFGQAKTEWEHNRALAVAKQAQGVAQVVDHLRIVSNGG